MSPQSLRDETALADVLARLKAAQPTSLRIRVSENMLTEFARLTGDHSALHVSDAFARRTIYRRPAVHGMLPVAFLAVAEGLRIEGLVGSPVAITGRFAGPVYVDDVLDLHVELGADPVSAAGIAFSYRVEKVGSSAPVTSGSITMSYREGATSHLSAAIDAGANLLAEPLSALKLALPDIAKGRSESFDFAVTDEAIRHFLAILAQGAGDDRAFERLVHRGGVDYPSFLALTLFSTLVGMRLPGDRATFLEFSADFDAQIARDTRFKLEGTITHVSRATRVLKAAVSICGARRTSALVRGKVAALVNEPPRLMPTIAEIRATALDMGIQDKVVVVTGASRGIGETIAKLLALHGARIIVNYHRGKDDAEQVAGEIQAAGGNAIAIQADVTRPEQVQDMVAEVKSRYGAIHVLINNAVRDYRPIPFLDLTWEEVQRDLDVIAKGAFLCCREVIPLMIEAGGGKIINISSVAVENPPPQQSKYVLAKSALVGLSRSLAVEFAAKNIQVNMVVPNFVETDLVSHIQEGFRKKIAQETPMQRHASPIDVAKAVLFLASSQASFTTGQKIMVTGGGVPYL